MRTCFKFAVLAVIGLVLLSQGVLANNEEEKQKLNETYHLQKYEALKDRKTYNVGDYSLAVLHIILERPDETSPTGKNVTLYKSFYFPKVDEFTELRNKFTQPFFEEKNLNVRVWLELPAFDLRSESRVMMYKYNGTYSDQQYDLIVGCRAITIVLESGVMKDLYWDDTCHGCSEKYCIEHSCSSVVADLRPTCDDKDALAEDPYHCGIKIYIAWIGTDKNNNSLSSYTSVPSRFEKYSFIASAYDAASGFASDFISFWKQPLN